MMGEDGPSEGPQPKEPDMANSTWAITHLLHEDCDDCLAEARNAVTMARVTGSVGATSKRDHREPAAVAVVPGTPLDQWPAAGELVVDHSATVTRVIALLPEEG